MSVRIKRIYDPAEASDGVRVLVDRVWPRGISKEQAALANWMKDVAPSAALRTWFGHVPERFAEFRRRYLEELDGPAAQDLLLQLAERARIEPVTLLYAAKDERHNQAVVLLERLERMMAGE